jgi:hypothetical protein
MSVSTAALLSSINQPPKKGAYLDRILHIADSFFRRLPIPNSQQAHYLSDWLKGEAENWYLTLDAAVQNDYATLVKALSDRFSNTGEVVQNLGYIGVRVLVFLHSRIASIHTVVTPQNKDHLFII